jgi:predicted small lipoprotein YifL
MTLSRRLQLVLCIGLVTTLAGCGEGGPAMHPVSGKVTIGGQPAADVLVTFQPSDATMESASGRTGADGSYTLTSGTQGKPGAMAGSYTVTLAQQSSGEVDMSAYSGGGSGGGRSSQAPTGPESNIPADWSKSVEVASGENTIDLSVE